jgi:LPS sulfotransferase NodH
MSDAEDDVVTVETGIDPAGLADDDLFRELASLHRTRLDTLRHGPDAALETHLRRTAELETEYMARYPGREVNPHRLTQDV